MQMAFYHFIQYIIQFIIIFHTNHQYYFYLLFAQYSFIIIIFIHIQYLILKIKSCFQKILFHLLLNLLFLMLLIHSLIS